METDVELHTKITREADRGRVRISKQIRSFAVLVVFVIMACTIAPLTKINIAQAKPTSPTSSGELLSRYIISANQGTDFVALKGVLQESHIHVLESYDDLPPWATVLASETQVAFLASNQKIKSVTPDSLMSTDQPADSKSNVIPGQYIIMLKPNSTTADQNAILNILGSKVQYMYSQVFKGFASQLSFAEAKSLRQNPAVAEVIPDEIYRVEESGSQSNPPWGLDRLDQVNLPVDNLYNYPSNGADVDVYIIDTGVQASHPEFGGRVSTATPHLFGAYATTDCQGHGTHVAGIVGSRTYGVAKAVHIIPVQVLDCKGSGSITTVIAGINWVIEHHQDGVKAVANMSLGGDYNLALNLAAASLVGDGVVLTVAAGNDRLDACNYSPASAPGSITVGATDSSDRRSFFSNYGSCVDIFAPGADILSTTMGSSSGVKSGTSMAAPHAAGAAAILWSLHPTWTAAEVSVALKESATLNKVKDPGSQSNNRLLFVGLPNGGTAPSPPRQVVATQTGVGVQISWATPQNSGSSQITQYEVFDHNNSSVCVWTIGPLQCVVNNLTPGTYSFTVTATNKSGTSAASSLSNSLTIASDSTNNDFFSQHKVLNPAISTVTDTNVGTTRELGEPQTYGTTNATKWFVVTPATTSPITIDLSGSSFDTVLGVFSGSNISQLQLIAKDDDSGDGATSKLTFVPTAGMSYAIQVGSYGGATGSIRLQWNSTDSCFTIPPSNNDSLNPVEVFGIGISCVNTVDATDNQSFEPFTDSTGHSVWYVMKPTQNTTATLDLSGSNFNTFLSVHRTSVFPPSDFSEFTTIAQDDDSGIGSTSQIVDLSLLSGYWYYVRVAGIGQDSGTAKLSWSIGTLPDAPTDVTAIAGNSTATISWVVPSNDGGSAITTYEVASNLGNYSCSTPTNSCTISNMAYGQFAFTVSAINSVGRGSISTSSNSIVVGNVNDTKAHAIQLTQALAYGSNQFATAETNEPNHGKVGAGKSMWYSVAVTALTQISINTSGSTFDTVLAVYSTNDTSGFSGLTEMTTNDDDPNGRDGSSQVSWLARANTHYLIAIDSYADPNPGFGSYTLNTTSEVVVKPSVPRYVRFSVDNVSANITWEKPTTGYSAISLYTVQAVGPKTLPTRQCTSNAARMRCKIDGLRAGQSYKFRVQAHNPVGDSPWTVYTAQAIIPNYYVASQITTSWALDRINQKIGITKLDGLTTYRGRGTSVRIYVVDTGVSATHQDLKGRVALSQNYATDHGTTDCNGHGTHVASLAAGTEFGVAPLATIIPVRVFGCDGSGNVSEVMEGLTWIKSDIKNKGKNAVVNMSLGGSSLDGPLEALVNQIIDLGVPVVVAAGNSAADACTFTPAKIPKAITVAATDAHDVPANYSNYGSCVDLYAPGSGITGADYANDKNYVVLSGTSMASPLVAGYVAVLKHMFPKISIDQISKVLITTARSNVLSGVPSGTPNKLLSMSSFRCTIIKNAGLPSLDSSPSDCGPLKVTATSTSASINARVNLSVSGGTNQFEKQLKVSGTGCAIIQSTVTSSRSGTCVVTASQVERNGFKAQTSTVKISFKPVATAR